MININSIDTCYRNINNLLNKIYVYDSDLNLNIFENENYYRDIGYRYEKRIFIDLINTNSKLSDIIYKNLSYTNFIKKILYYRKHYIDNPNNDLFLIRTNVDEPKDISTKFICDINLSNFLKDKYIKNIFAFEFIRNLYYYISTDDYYNFTNKKYKFIIPISYYISDIDNSIIKNDFITNIIIEIDASFPNNYISVNIINEHLLTKNLIEFLKPIITFHCYLINIDHIISLNKNDPIYTNSDDRIKQKKYAIQLSKAYDLNRFSIINNIINSFDQENIKVIDFKTNYFQIIINHYLTYSLLEINTNISNLSNDTSLPKNYDLICPAPDAILAIEREDTTLHPEIIPETNPESTPSPIIIPHDTTPSPSDNIIDDRDWWDIYLSKNNLIVYGSFITCIVIILLMSAIFIKTKSNNINQNYSDYSQFVGGGSNNFNYMYIGIYFLIILFLIICIIKNIKSKKENFQTLTWVDDTSDTSSYTNAIKYANNLNTQINYQDISKVKTVIDSIKGSGSDPLQISSSVIIGVPCAPGTQSSTGYGDCTACQSGTFSAAGANECTKCPVGKYSDVDGATTCEDCPAGKGTLSSGSTSSNDCNVNILLTECVNGDGNKWCYKYRDGNGNFNYEWKECPTNKILNLSNFQGNTASNNNHDYFSGTFNEQEAKACKNIPENSIKKDNKTWECGHGYWKDGEECKSYDVCNSDQYQQNIPSSTQNRICETITECNDDQYVVTASTITNNRECEDLPDVYNKDPKPRIKNGQNIEGYKCNDNDGFFTPWIKNVSGDCVEMTQDLNLQDTTPIPQCITTILSQSSYNTFRSKEDCENISFSPDTISDATSLPPVGYIIYDTGWWTDYEELVSTRLEEITYEDGDRAKYANWQRRLQVADILKLKEQAMKKLEECGYKNELAQHQYEGYKEAIESAESYLSELVPKIKEMEKFALEQTTKLKHCYDVLNNFKDEDEMCKYHLDKDSIFQKYLNTEDITLDESIIEDNYVLDNLLNKDASSIRAFYDGIKVALKDLPISQIDLSNFDKYFKGDHKWDVDKIISNLYLGQLGKLQKISIQEIQNIINKPEYSELKNIIDEKNPSISRIIEKIKIIVENSGNKLKIAKASQQLEEVVIEVNNIKGYKLLTDLLMGILLVQYNDANNTYDIQLKLTNDADKKVKILKQIESDAYRKLAELIKLTSEAGDVCSVEYKSEEDIKYDIEQLIEEVKKYEDLYDKSNNFYVNILDRLKKLHESDVDIKLETTEQKIRQEVIELLNISLYTRAEVEKIIKEKYKKLKIEYLIEYEIYIDEMEIKRKNDEITLLLGIQFEELIINKEVNKKLNELTATIAGLDNLILTTEHRYEVDVVEWQQELKNLQDKIIILLNKELDLHQQLSAITNNIELELKPEIDKIETDIIILRGISGTGDAITAKENDKAAKELELSGQEGSKHNIGSNYNSKKEERELELSRYYVLFGSIETDKIAGLEAIVKIKNNHEKLLLMQIHFQKELVSESLKLSNTSLDILNKKEEQLFLLEKIQTVKKRDIEYSIRSVDISIKFLNNEEISLLKIKDEEEKRENLLSKRQKELYDILKIKEKKIKDLEDSLKNTENPQYQHVINSDLEIISKETTIERTARLRLNSAQTSLNDIKYKKLLTQLLIYKNNIDINIYKLITKVKEISNYNTEIQILVFKKDIEGLKLNKNKLKLHILNNEYDRLTKMHKYILIEITTNKKTSLLYDKIKTEIEKSNSVDKIADISSINDLIGENESKLIELEREKDNIYNKINNISKILKKLNLKINKLEKELIKNVETYEYNIDAKGRSKQQLVEILIQTMSDITKIVTFYNELRDNITKEGIELPLIAILPIEIPNKINNKIHDIFDDTDLDFKTYANKYSFVNQISGILNAFTTDKNDYYIKPAEFKIILNKEYTSILDLTDFKNNLKIELTSLLNIDISSLIIKSVNKSSIGNNTVIEAKILGSTYKNPLYIIQDFIKLEIEKSSKIYDLDILKDLISLEYIPKEGDDSLTSPYQNTYNIDISGKNILTSSSQISETFKYARVSCLHENLLIYYQFISKNKNTNDTLKDISTNPKIMYQALHGSEIKKIYENYIELDKTLLQVKNINLSNMETFTISFIAKLNQNANPSQNIILSNGIISEKLSYGTYDNIIKEQIITDNNILSIGFLKSSQNSPTYKLYVKLPCKGKKRYNNITSTDINTGQWYHWIITKDNDKVTIYKNRIMNNDKSIIDTEENILSYSDTQNSHDHLYNNHHEKDICYTDHSIYNSKNLYIGGVKMDIDRFTREINEFTSFKGGLKDLRIYDIKLTKTQIDNIFIENSVDDGTTILGCGGVSTVGAISSSSDSSGGGGGGGGGGSGGSGSGGSGGGGGSGGSGGSGGGGGSSDGSGGSGGGGAGGGSSFFGAGDVAGFSLGSGNTGDKLTELWEEVIAPSLSSTVSTGISQ